MHYRRRSENISMIYQEQHPVQQLKTEGEEIAGLSIVKTEF